MSARESLFPFSDRRITPAEEKFAPPDEIIELAVVEDTTTELAHEETDEGRRYWNLKYPRKLVCLSLSEYAETSEGSTLKRKIEFPAIDLNDLIRALNAFGIAGGALHFGEPPVRLPAPPQEQSAE